VRDAIQLYQRLRVAAYDRPRTTHRDENKTKSPAMMNPVFVGKKVSVRDEIKRSYYCKSNSRVRAVHGERNEHSLLSDDQVS
jgi:hypothetical protein